MGRNTEQTPTLSQVKVIVHLEVGFSSDPYFFNIEIFGIS